MEADLQAGGAITTLEVTGTGEAIQVGATVVSDPIAVVHEAVPLLVGEVLLVVEADVPVEEVRVALVVDLQADRAEEIKFKSSFLS